MFTADRRSEGRRRRFLRTRRTGTCLSWKNQMPSQRDMPTLKCVAATASNYPVQAPETSTLQQVAWLSMHTAFF